MKVTTRRRFASAGSAQTVRTASAIMVPPLASSASMCARAARFISGLASWGWEEHVRGVAEVHDLEGVVRVHVVQDPAHGLLRLLEREAGLRAGAVDHEDHLLGRCGLGRDPLRREEDEGRVAVAAGVAVREVAAL